MTGRGPSLTHIALQVRDLDRSAAFYETYCGLKIVHERNDRGTRILWLAEPGRERDFIIVLMPGGQGHVPAQGDYSHLGFALASKAEVDAMAQRAQAEGRLVWPPKQEPFPVGYYCGVVDPDGTMVEFSYGQPLGPGAREEAERTRS
ncbi:MAG TPA: VOC family protein [Alphaproteobacteria bacterium]|nr:VOC family protein [Alphaproteobacteria bacterium]